MISRVSDDAPRVNGPHLERRASALLGRIPHDVADRIAARVGLGVLGSLEVKKAQSEERLGSATFNFEEPAIIEDDNLKYLEGNSRLWNLYSQEYAAVTGKKFNGFKRHGFSDAVMKLLALASTPESLGHMSDLFGEASSTDVSMLAGKYRCSKDAQYVFYALLQKMRMDTGHAADKKSCEAFEKILRAHIQALVRQDATFR